VFSDARRKNLITPALIKTKSGKGFAPLIIIQYVAAMETHIQMLVQQTCLVLLLGQPENAIKKGCPLGQP